VFGAASQNNFCIWAMRCGNLGWEGRRSATVSGLSWVSTAQLTHFSATGSNTWTAATHS